MAVRVVARIRPQQQNELETETILSTVNNQETSEKPTLIKIPNPKNESEVYSFQFSGVYDHFATQQQIFDNEGERGPHSIDPALEDTNYLQYRPLSSISSTGLMSPSLRMAVPVLEKPIP